MRTIFRTMTVAAVLVAGGGPPPAAAWRAGETAAAPAPPTHIAPAHITAFKAATLAKATASVQEPDIARFDVLQDHANPTHFVLVEIYRTQEATVAHKETAHYAAWRDAVVPMMVQPRTSVKYSYVFDTDRV